MNQDFGRTIGILGGVGPAATAYSFSRLMNICQSDYGCRQDKDYPNVILVNMPIDGINEKGFADDLKLRRHMKQKLSKGYQLLETAGAELVYTACNTLNTGDFLKADKDLEEVSLVEQVVEYLAKEHQFQKVAVLGSEATRREATYQKSLKVKGFKYQSISEEMQARITKLILAAMGSDDLVAAKKELLSVCKELLNEVKVVVIGCTELSLILGQRVIEEGGVVDAQEAVLREILKRSKL